MIVPLRTRLAGALVAAVLLSVGTATALYLREVSSQLDRQLEERADLAVAGVQAELAQLGARLDLALDAVAGDPRRLARLRPSAPAGERYSQAAQLLEPGAVDVLDAIAPDGTTLSSAHWPTRIDLPQDLPEATDDGPHIVRLATPRGPRPAIVRVRRVAAGADSLWLVAGRWLDRADLEESRDRLGVQRLDLRWGGDEPEARGQVLRRATLLGEAGPQLVVGVDRSDVARLQRRLRWQALAVATASALGALALGLALSRGIVRPVEALAEAAPRLAGGDLDAQVPPGRSGVREVEELVAAFNAMGADLVRSRDQLVQAERVAAWREIARGLAHELKNPLTPIRGAMDVIRRARALDRPDFDAILEEQATAVISEVGRLKELGDSFARFARLPDPKPQPLDAGAILRDVATLYARGDGLSVVLDLEPAPVRADRNQLATVLSNLVKNAVEALEGRGTVTLRARRQGEEVELRVEDDGPGLAAEVRGRLFTPYVTTKGSRGTGLGLAMAHRIILEHGGRIEAEDPPVGAAFVIHLPADPPPA